MDVLTAVKEFLAAKLALSPYTLRGYKRYLGLFASWCDEQGLQLEQLTARHVRAFLEAVSKRPGYKGGPLKHSTLRIYAISVKAFLNWCSREEEFEDLVSYKVARRVELPRSDQGVIETFTPEQVASLFKAAEKQPDLLAVRDKAILAVLVDTGIRAAELCSLVLECTWTDPDDSFIKVQGKGRKEREVPLGRMARIALRRYITRYRKPAERGDKHVFLSRVGTPLTTRGLDQVVQRLARAAHIKGAHAHKFRHFFAVQFLLAGGEIYKLSRLMGHSSVKITERYLSSMHSQQVRKQGQSVLDHLQEK